MKWEDKNISNVIMEIYKLIQTDFFVFSSKKEKFKASKLIYCVENKFIKCDL